MSLAEDFMYVSIFDEFSKWKKYVSANPRQALKFAKKEIEGLNPVPEITAGRLRWLSQYINQKEKEFDKNKKLHERIVQFARNYPVNSLKTRSGESIWPIFRFYLYLMAELSYADNYSGIKVFDRKMDAFSRKIGREALGFNEISEFVPAGKYDFLVFSAPGSMAHARMEGKIHDRLLDPLIHRLNRYGATRKVVMLPGGRFIKPDFQEEADFFLPSAKYVINNFYDHDNFDEFAEAVVEYFKEYKLSISDIKFLLDAYYWEYNDYLRILQKYSPKAIFFFPYDFHIPLVRAAHDLGITACDIQHGNMLGFSIQYNFYDEQPCEGYRMFPDAVLTWSENEKKHIEETFNKVQGVVFGYPGLEECKKLKSVCHEELQNFCSRFKTIVIVSLSGQAELPRTILDIIRHPLAKKEKLGFIIKRNPRRYETAIPESDNVYANDEIANEAFLTLAQYASLHITEHSSCLYEADNIGLHTILTGAFSRNHFAHLIEAGRITYARNAEEFFSSYKGLLKFCHYPRLIDNGNQEFDAFMANLCNRKQPEMIDQLS